MLDVQFAVKFMIGRPLSLPGLNETFNAPFPLAATTSDGAAGTVAGTTATDATDGGPGPSRFDADTVHVYDFALVSAVTVIGDPAAKCALGTPPLLDAHVAV